MSEQLIYTKVERPLREGADADFEGKATAQSQGDMGRPDPTSA